jgi:hypothetical protein
MQISIFETDVLNAEFHQAERDTEQYEDFYHSLRRFLPITWEMYTANTQICTKIYKGVA